MKTGEVVSYSWWISRVGTQGAGTFRASMSGQLLLGTKLVFWIRKGDWKCDSHSSEVRMAEHFIIDQEAFLGVLHQHLQVETFDIAQNNNQE